MSPGTREVIKAFNHLCALALIVFAMIEYGKGFYAQAAADAALAAAIVQLRRYE